MTPEELRKEWDRLTHKVMTGDDPADREALREIDRQCLEAGIPGFEGLKR